MVSLSDTASPAQTGNGGTRKKAAADAPKRGTGQWVGKSPDGQWAIFSAEIDALRYAVPRDAAQFVEYGSPIPK